MFLKTLPWYKNPIVEHFCLGDGVHLCEPRAFKVCICAKQVLAANTSNQPLNKNLILFMGRPLNLVSLHLQFPRGTCFMREPPGRTGLMTV